MFFRRFRTARDPENFLTICLITIGTDAKRLVASATADLLVLNRIT